MTTGRPQKIGGHDLCNTFFQKSFSSFSNIGYLHTNNISQVLKYERNKIHGDTIEMNAKKHIRRRCYALLWGGNCTLSHCKTRPEEIARVKKIGMYCKRYIRDFVNPSKPFAHALLGIMICSCWKLFLSYVCIWQPC